MYFPANSSYLSTTKLPIKCARWGGLSSKSRGSKEKHKNHIGNVTDSIPKWKITQKSDLAKKKIDLEWKTRRKLTPQNWQQQKMLYNRNTIVRNPWDSLDWSMDELLRFEEKKLNWNRKNPNQLTKQSPNSTTKPNNKKTNKQINKKSQPTNNKNPQPTN